MDWQKEYARWQEFDGLDPALKESLTLLEKDPELLEDSFYRELEFGTGGIRGELGPGINRMNLYTIRKAAEGLARYIEENGEEAKSRGVAIAYDSRFKSAEFALEAAKTLGAHGIQTYVFESLRSTPELSFAVRYLHAFNGIVITASHNPPEYNGFKVYGEDGAQVTSSAAEVIISKVNGVEDELAIEIGNEDELKASGLLSIIGETVDRAYMDNLKTVTVNPDVIQQVADDFTIVYTPLHGTGNIPVRKGLEAIGFKYVEVVPEQEKPDSRFPTVKYPNPEEHAAFELAIKYGEQHNADLLMATDPDTDRVGVAVRGSTGDFEVLTGNQVGALLLHYLIEEKQKQNTLPAAAVVLKTIVTSEIGRNIAESYGIETIDTLTGFKYIGEKIQEFEKTGEKSFLFGYEESYGYLIKDFVRDKDAIQTCMLVAEVAAYYKSKGMTLYEGLQSLFKEFGYYKEGLESLTLKGKDGTAQIGEILSTFRNYPPDEFAGHRVTAVEDYQESVRTLTVDQHQEQIVLPKSNVLKYKLEEGSWVCLRPSGTEPKIKFYFGVKGETAAESDQLLASLRETVMARVHDIVQE